MAVKFNSLNLCHVLTLNGKVRDLFNTNNRLYGKFVVKLIYSSNTLDLNKGAHLDVLGDGRDIFCIYKHLDCN